MLTFLCVILCIVLFFKLLSFSFAFSWGAAKLIVSILIGMVGIAFAIISGLFFIVLPVLAIIGIIHLLTCKTKSANRKLICIYLN